MSDPQQILFEAFDGLDRLAPGSEASTVRALEVARGTGEPRRILDLGCGVGAQTLVLAERTRAEITGVDAHAPFLRRLETRAAERGIGARIHTLKAGMGDLDGQVSPGSFDLLWAEGSLYTIGFDHGLRVLRPLMASRGVFAFTELSWFTPTPSAEAREFWGAGYPAMREVESNLAAARAAGYTVLEHFCLPAGDWADYYGPLEQRIAQLRDKYRSDGDAQSVLDSIHAEIDLYARFGSEYGYVFYVVAKED
jgi:SAM-dependent methyltransferase